MKKVFVCLCGYEKKNSKSVKRLPICNQFYIHHKIWAIIWIFQPTVCVKFMTNNIKNKRKGEKKNVVALFSIYRRAIVRYFYGSRCKAPLMETDH